MGNYSQRYCWLDVDAGVDVDIDVGDVDADLDADPDADPEHLEAKSAFKFNLEAIRKEYAFCTPKRTPLEANLGFMFEAFGKEISQK